jgi:ABC-type phosphate transport system substrate-binding protein
MMFDRFLNAKIEKRHRKIIKKIYKGEQTKWSRTQGERSRTFCLYDPRNGSHMALDLILDEF